MSGFTGSGYPKVVPIEAGARRISDANFRGQKFQVSVFTGASTGPELDERSPWREHSSPLPYQSDPETRKRINAGEMDYMIHLTMSPSSSSMGSSASSMSRSSKSPLCSRTAG